MKLYLVRVKRTVSYITDHAVACESKKDVRKKIDDWTSHEEFYTQAEDDDHIDKIENKIVSVEKLNKKNIPDGYSIESYPHCPDSYIDDCGSIGEMLGK